MSTGFNPSRRSRIGVALCTYNGERYLAQQLESIAAQTRPPDAVVICDDRSTDRTLELARAWKSSVRFQVEVLQNERNLGYRLNFQRAIAESDADIIVLSDQDDRWLPHKIERMEAVFREGYEVGAAFSDAEIVDAQLRPLGYTLLEVLKLGDAERRAARAGDLLTALLRRNLVAGATLAFRGSWKPQLLPLPSSCVHDEWIALWFAAFGSLRLVPEALIEYRQHDKNQIGGKRLDLYRHLNNLVRLRRSENLRVLQVLQALQDRLASARAPHDALARVRSKIEHLKCRTSLATDPVRRVRSILQETANGRYRTYSSGWKSAVRDLVLPV